MARDTRQAERRAQPLSKERIVAAAIAILDAEGEDALTFRALAGRLATGSGAIYWHVADKNELLAAAADHVVMQAVAKVGRQADPREAIRAIAVAVFKVVDTHPWVGAHLNREPWRPGIVQVFERLGSGVLALGVPEPAQFDAWSALVNYVLGVAGQNATNARLSSGTNRSAFLENVAARWERLDAEEHPFVRRLAARLREHDDCDQFLSGVDLILAGMRSVE